MQADDLRLLGIPRWRRIIAIVYPHHDAYSKIAQASRPRKRLAACISVARVRPRRESWLVSFPPLSYMFKFSGSSFLTWGLILVFCLFLFQGFIELQSDAWRLLGRVHHAARVSHSALTVLEVIFFWGKTPNTALSFHLRKKKEQMGGNRHSCRNASRSTRKRNLRSKIWWFTEFCNSHYVSHFAAFFIVARTKTSAAKSYFKVIICI